MKGDDADRPEGLKTASAAGQRSLDADWAAADEDQTAADADQTGSDADQTAAALDAADSASDQRASDADQASAYQLRREDDDAATRATFQATRIAREKTTTRRLTGDASRAGTAQLRIKTTAQREATASARDETARRRDLRAEATELAIASSDAPLAEKLHRLRVRAAAARTQAAKDRAFAARERADLEAELLGAHLDDLTGVFRREVGWLTLSHEIDRARRADGRFVIAFVDIDGLKRVNDRDGHAAGDHVLKALVLTMRSNLRSFDPIVRYGGDEFVCGIGGVDLDQVQRRFEVIDRSVRDDVGVGISVGLAALSADETLDQLTARADAALLTAKKRRRK